MANIRKSKKSNKLISVRNSTSSRPLSLGNMSPNQLNSFFSIRKFEEKNIAKIGRSGVLARTLAKEADMKNEFLSRNPDLMIKEYSKAASQIRIPAAVPLKLPDSAIELVRRNKLEKILVTPNSHTNSVKIALVDKTGGEKILVEGQKNSFKNRTRKDTAIGLIISEDSNLSMSIPQSPASLESSSSKNQGNVLYKLGL